MALPHVRLLDLDPSADQARQWLRDELARSEYQDTRSLFQRLMDWIGERLADLQGTLGTGGLSLPPVAITLVVVLLVVALGYLVTRVRVESRTVSERTTLLGNTAQTAEQLRRDAEKALSDGRFGDAVLAWTRAMARDAERRTLLPDARSMTAHEVGAALGVAFPDHAGAIDRTIDRFDGVAYGDLDATRDDAWSARSTDETLRIARPAFTPRRRGRPADDDRGGPPPPAQADPAAGRPDPPSVWMTGVGS
jgi:hypothetical protein